MNSANGVVTLSGSVGSDAERAAVATDASKVDGIKMLVNNLQVQAAQAAPPANDQQMAQQQAPEPEPERRGKQAATSTRGHNRSARPTPSAANKVTDYSNNAPQQASNAPAETIRL